MSKPNAFAHRFRVYFEDTDAGGVVYYANYLRFHERARTECLRGLGYSQSALMEQGIAFAVRSLSAEYLKPARLDDELLIEARIGEIGRAFLVFEQRALRAGELLATASVKVACVDVRRLAPARLPAALLSKIAVLPNFPIQ